MIINHNVAALNTYNQLSTNSINSSSSLSKLSSGLQINKASDDAAGLAISEKMRGQIRGLDQASSNAQDAISMLQTGEGALNETTSILQRMRELAVQAANDTATDTDRNSIQQEMDQLAQEVTRISNTTEFNTKNLLGGNLKDSTFQIGANQGQNMKVSISAMDAQTLGIASNAFLATASAVTDVTGVTVDKNDKGTAIIDGASLTLSANDTAAKTTWAAGDTGLTGLTAITSTDNSSQYNGYKLITTVSGTSTTATIDDTAKTITLNVKSDFDTAANINTAFTTAGISLTATGDVTAGGGDPTGHASTADGLAADEVKLTIGSGSVIVKETATSATFTDAANKGLTVILDGAISAATAATIAIKDTASTAATFAADGTMTKATVAAGINVSTQNNADNAITSIQKAIDTVSAERSKLGAYENRLEHTINNLSTSSENMTAAESAIRDVDMAKEMMEFTKTNILSQAATAMLAQANQQPQQVLKLLQ